MILYNYTLQLHLIQTRIMTIGFHQFSDELALMVLIFSSKKDLFSAYIIVLALAFYFIYVCGTYVSNL